MKRWELQINGRRRAVEAAPGTPLLWVLRDGLDLEGTKYGCGIGLCGACTVHVEGRPTRSCLVAIEDVGSRQVVTIEGLSPAGDHPVQRAWMKIGVPQCGYCQSGQIMQAAALLDRVSTPSDEDIDAAMGDNLCRCGTYQRIRRAIHPAAETARRRPGGSREERHGPHHAQRGRLRPPPGLGLRDGGGAGLSAGTGAGQAPLDEGERRPQRFLPGAELPPAPCGDRLPRSRRRLVPPPAQPTAQRPHPWS